MSLWFLPAHWTDYLRIGVFGLLLISMAGVLAVTTRRKMSSIKMGQLMPSVIFITIYMGTLLMSATTNDLPINDRYLAPVYTLLMFLLMAAFVEFFALLGRHTWKIAISLSLIAVFCIWLGYTAILIRENVIDMAQHGVDQFNRSVWQDSKFLNDLRKNPLKGHVYSNFPDAVYILTGTRVKFTPSKHIYNSPDSVVNDLSVFKDFVKSHSDTLLVWFDYNRGPQMYGLAELSSLFNLELLGKWPDGGVYRVKPSIRGP